MSSTLIALSVQIVFNYLVITTPNQKQITKFNIAHTNLQITKFIKGVDRLKVFTILTLPSVCYWHLVFLPVYHSETPMAGSVWRILNLHTLCQIQCSHLQVPVIITKKNYFSLTYLLFNQQ